MTGEGSIASRATLCARVKHARRLSFDGRDEELLAWLADDAAATDRRGSDANLQVQCLALRAQSLVRLGRFSQAMQTYLEAPAELSGPAVSRVARTCLPAWPSRASTLPLLRARCRWPQRPSGSR